MSSAQARLESCRIDPHAWAFFFEKAYKLSVKAFSRAKRQKTYETAMRYIEIGKKASEVMRLLGDKGIKAKICYEEVSKRLMDIEKMLWGDRK